MKIIANRLIPFKGFTAINLFGLCFVRKEYVDLAGEASMARTLNHERIHTAQQRELLFAGFYIAYFFEWVYRLIFHTKSAYSGISFEREAYEHERDEHYLKTRRHYAQWRSSGQEK